MSLLRPPASVWRSYVGPLQYLWPVSAGAYTDGCKESDFCAGDRASHMQTGRKSQPGLMFSTLHERLSKCELKRQHIDRCMVLIGCFRTARRNKSASSHTASSIRTFCMIGCLYTCKARLPRQVYWYRLHGNLDLGYCTQTNVLHQKNYQLIHRGVVGGPGSLTVCTCNCSSSCCSQSIDAAGTELLANVSHPMYKQLK